MGNQDDNFLSNDAFGVQATSVISEDVAELIFGGGATANPADVTPIETEDEKKKKETEKKEEIKELTSDDILEEFVEDKTKNPKKEKPDPKVEVTKEEDETPEVEEDNTFSVLTKELLKVGIFTPREKEDPIENAEQFKARWELEKTEQINSSIYNFLQEKHGEEGMEAFKAIFVDGVPVKDYLSKYAEVQAIEDIDIEQEANQEKVFKEYYRRQGWNSEKIDKKLQKSKDYGDLEEESKDLYELLIQQDKEDLAEMQERASEQEKAKLISKQQYKNNLNKILGDKLKEKEFDGIPVTEKVARETYDYLYNEKWQLPTGEKLTDFDKDILELRLPENHEKKVKIGLLLKQNLDLSKVKTSAVSKEADRLFGDLQIKDKHIKRTTKATGSKGFFEL